MASTITVVTTRAKNKILEARAGNNPIPPIKYMAFGDGGQGWVPTGTDNALQNELLRKEITGKEVITETQYRYKCLIGTDELQNTVINEMGLVDEAGDFVCIIACANKEKDDDIEMEFYIDDIMN